MHQQIKLEVCENLISNDWLPAPSKLNIYQKHKINRLLDYHIEIPNLKLIFVSLCYENRGFFDFSTFSYIYNCF